MPIQGYSNYDAVGLAELVASGQVTPAELLEEAITRVERVNGEINAVVYPYYDEARERALSGLPEGPLRGVPFLLKDLYVLYAGQPMSNGSRMFEGYVPDHDSAMTTRYKAAGLSIFGRSDLARVRDHRDHRVDRARQDPQPVEPRIHRRRLLGRRGGCCGRGHSAGRQRVRRGRLDSHPGLLLRPVRPQADARANALRPRCR